LMLSFSWGFSDDLTNRAQASSCCSVVTTWYAK
jgi:hypothetical protein